MDKIDKLDKKILSILSLNARMPFKDVAAECGVSRAAIHQRVAKLTNLGIIKGSQFIIDPEKIGYETCAYVGLYLKNPEQFDHVVDELKKIPEVVECHYTTGQYAVFVKVYAKDNEHLRDILSDKIQKISGVASTETFISLDETFKREVPIF